MIKLVPVILVLLIWQQKVFCRRLYGIDDNYVYNAESQFPKPHAISNGDGPPHHTWGFNDYEAFNEDEYPDRVVFPGSEWRVVSTTSPTAQRKIRQCLTSCQSNFEVQPVCGTDGVTYHNLEQLQCYMRCGVGVNIRQLSPCPGWQGTTASPIVSSSTSNNLQDCLTSCPTTPEYNPVCGSDRVTYKNHGKLMCAQFCGKDVQLSRRSPCPKSPTTIDPIHATSTTPRTTTLSTSVRTCMITCHYSPEYEPVCGTNKETYLNLSRLQCAAGCGVDVSLLKSAPCHVNTIEAKPKPQEDPNYTIPQDLLDSIFNNNNNNNDQDNDDDNFDINVRLKS